MQAIEQTLDSREVAEMVDKPHYELLKDMHRYTSQFNEINIDVVKKVLDFCVNIIYDLCVNKSEVMT